MALPTLQAIPNGPTLPKEGDTQRTSFSLDVLGRFICNTLDEALYPNCGQPSFNLMAEFDAIVIGSGMYGAYCAARLWRNGAKVLVLEAGPFLISEHSQNLTNVGLGTGGQVNGYPNLEADEIKDQVWGLPWRGNQIFGRQAFCVGGKSLFWGGWSPRLTDDVLSGPLAGGASWPAAAANYLKSYYDRIELQLGVSEYVVDKPGQNPTPKVKTDLFNDPEKNTLTMALDKKLQGYIGEYEVIIPRNNSLVKTVIEAIDPAPIAIQADAPASGLFSFDKYSSLPVLVEALREDISKSDNCDQRRRLFIVPNTSVRKLMTESNGTDYRVGALELWDGQQRQTIKVPGRCQVVLALSAIESTRLALESFGGIPPLKSLIGRNLMAHLRNNFTVRIRREAIGVKDMDILQTSAFNIVGKSSTGGRYHLQFYAGFQPGASAEAVLYRMLPDIESARSQLANQDPEWVAVTFRGCGEMIGRTDLVPGDESASYINLSQDYDRIFPDQRRAWVYYIQQKDDLTLFDEMDQAAFSLALKLADSPSNIQYWDNLEERWNNVNPYAYGQPLYGKLNTEKGIRDPLGTTYHDSGTLWMGEDSNNSITDYTGRFHKVRNCFCVDQAIFPRIGSANPVPTGLALARQGAETIANGDLKVGEERNEKGEVTALYHQAEPDFKPLFIFDRDALLPRGWKHIGPGNFSRFGLVLESTGGIGLLYHEMEEFTDFTLRLQWRAPTIQNNSGVYVRMPAQKEENIYRLRYSENDAIKTGYEIQIDNTGRRPEVEFGDGKLPEEPFNQYHQTGAIYPVNPTNNFPTDTNLPEPNGTPSIRDIPSHALDTWNDLEILVGGDQIRVVLNGVRVLQDGDYHDMKEVYKRGLIALQNHSNGYRVQFRHVRIKPGMPQF